MDIYQCCSHCNHDTPWGGSDTLTSDGKHHTEPCAQCQVEA